MFLPLLVKTTFNSKADAEKMAMALLDQGLIACAQISGPTQSCYWWQGKIETQEEYVLAMKSEASLYNSLEQEIKKNHPYDTPEIIGTEITRIYGEYKAWMAGELDLD
jgi:periplasmic divalent cation tolerance protein